MNVNKERKICMLQCPPPRLWYRDLRFLDEAPYSYPLIAIIVLVSRFFTNNSKPFLLAKLQDSNVYISTSFCSWIHKEESDLRFGKGMALACYKAHPFILLHE